MTEQELLKLLDMGEHSELECKLAKGGLPKDVWETYSAFANTKGGIILLGIEENNGVFSPVKGVDVVKLQKAFWDHINSKQVSVNILQNDDVQPIKINEYNILKITVPRALRQQKPVSVNENPYIGTYRRNFEGDYRCSKEEVDNMIAEASNITRDSIVLDKYSFDDFDKDSFKRYRQRFAVRNPSNSWNELDDIEFLRRIGGWDKDREKKVEGLTAAGLLVFGQEMNITNYFHNYFLDYREHVNEYEGQRWSHRFTSQNGEWSGNLYDFYNKVIARINEDLKVPFKIDDADMSRVNDTDLHKALREALLNTIIHADYFTKGNIIVEKNINEYKFINPGLLRIPLEKAISGGTSDARNKNIFKIFSLLGLGERSGFGLENIHNTWKKYKWELPSLEESFKPENITLLLKTTPLIDNGVSQELKKLFPNKYDTLDPYELKLLSFLYEQESITLLDAQTILNQKSTFINKIFMNLEQKQIIEKNYDNAQLSYTFFNSNKTDRDLLDTLRMKVTDIANSRRAKPQHLREAVLTICEGRFLTLREIAEILNRNETHLRKTIINPLLESNELILKYPNKPTHMNQAYKTYNLFT